MILYNAVLESWFVWFVLCGLMIAYELFAVFTEKKTGRLPLTRVLRDRIMKRSGLAKLGILLFLTWLWLHFLLPGNGW